MKSFVLAHPGKGVYLIQYGREHFLSLVVLYIQTIFLRGFGVKLFSVFHSFAFALFMETVGDTIKARLVILIGERSK